MLDNDLKETAILANQLQVNEIHFQVIIPIGNAEHKDLGISPEEWEIIKVYLKNDPELNNLSTSVCYQERFLHKNELRSVINSGYSCSLNKESTYWVLPNGRVYHCLCLINTAYNSKIFDFTNGKFKKNKLDSVQVKRFMRRLCNYGYCSNTRSEYVSICPVWKNYTNKPPY